ncbi:MAG: tRNA preQ1(34) S-adenosylmethionine ribosyltransferase-isomerase QueA [Oscillospiraceae bacterium]
MNTHDFYYDLPEELIAQTPLYPRDSSRMLVVDKETGVLCHKHFYDVIDFLNEGDLLVINNSRVIPARLYGIKIDTLVNVELLLLEQINNNTFETLVKPGRRIKEGAKLSFGEGKLTGTITKVKDDGNRVIQFDCNENIYQILDEIGQMPLPPYITQKLEDKERYQTVYSKDAGSSAAPTAGLHFTTELLEKIKAKGVNIAEVTLHVGLGTFRPVKVDKIEEHKMHTEHYYISDSTIDLINKTKANGKRVIGVGTTSCRTLESYAKTGKKIDDTSIFIYPPYNFKIIDGLITNFHLPESTLIMLVSAFCGYQNTMNAYKVAVEEKYRFFSFGDAMLII